MRRPQPRSVTGAGGTRLISARCARDEPSQAGSDEVLLDDAARLAANAGRDDVDVTLQVAREDTHVFQLYFAALDEADQAIGEAARFFRRHLR